ncbi:ubiquinone biosynthesis protein coq7 homolog [Plasmopara halstedii]|uniref:Ubiquinone biosynthesis protein coq7 homolog n=1 Tax=Plasmopara halstedii TaxID=4781 RepID=A0A0P1AYC6_PLAHL|nr:ubiquinone biosynthesis protein coq7 homolog [Plasmopara halstedii]CEG46581.1 ubiquinone biosynthesis protein coq7 homolog [Plasmopara halstedii]|eukprot:XP_024582950.1 ubiquinone biosynthesis protein coq7 homolog [Plasmopara halstedii]
MRRASTYTRINWLEKNCGNVPITPHTLNGKISEMVRGGQAIQLANAKMLDAKVANFRVLNMYSAEHSNQLKDLRDTEKKALHRIDEAAQSKDLRFRPSLVIPAIKLCSYAIGCALRPLGDSVSVSYIMGVKMAVSEYYNDQIREIHSSCPDMVELKELFKQARDEEQSFVDAHTLDPNKHNQDPVAMFAKTTLKLLTQVATAL